MKVKTFELGPLQTNTYVLWDEDTREAIVVDPADEPDTILGFLKDNNLTLKYIFLTHAHFDHVGAVPEIKEATKVPLLLHKEELYIYEAARDMAAFWGFDIDPLPEVDRPLEEGFTLSLGEKQFQVIHTPGHSPGSICLYGSGMVFTGDTIFAGSVGRTDFEGGDINKLRESFRRLMKLPDETQVFPGHGPSTTIVIERDHNPFSQEFL